MNDRPVRVVVGFAEPTQADLYGRAILAAYRVTPVDVHTPAEPDPAGS